MGVDISAAQLLLGEQDSGVPFARTLTLGRQRLYMTPSELRQACPECIGPDPADSCQSLFSRLGAHVIDAIDASS